MSLGTFRQRPVRHRWLFGITTTAMVTFIALFVTSALGVLPGSPSKFEANDGDMIVTTAGNNDWASVAFTRVDDAESVTTDDSFQPGQKQDTTCPVVEGHKNPPKDDFTDTAEFSETNATTGDVYLYGATIRVAENGNASENVELNQGTGGTCPGSTVLARVAGDKLIAIDYVSGGPQFHVLTWVTSGACFVSNDAPPCWGATVVTLDPNTTEGAVNASPITAANNPINHLALNAGQFAEFGVNLVASGIIPAGSCKSFTQSVFESRSSGSSFVSTVKDITISQRAINVCPTLIIKKVGSDGGSQAGAVFTLYSGSGTGGPIVGTCTINADGNCVNDAPNSTFPPSFTLNPGTYTLDETTVPSGYLKDASLPVTFTLAASETRTINVTDVRLPSLTVKKVGTDGGSQAGAVFTLYSGPDTSGTVVGTCTVNADGNCVNPNFAFPPSFKDLSPGTYTLDETTVPSGYSKDATLPFTFTLAAGETKTFTFTDVKLANVIVKKVGSDGGSQAGAVFTLYSGPDTSGTVVGTCTVNAEGNCVNDAPGSTFPPSFANLSPGTYTLDETVVPSGYAKDATLPTTFTLAQNETKTIMATDIRLVGAIKIEKRSTKTGLLVTTPGAVFSYDGSIVFDNGVGDSDPVIGSICVAGLATGSYTVNETAPPPGYGAASESGLIAQAVTGTNCASNPPSGSGVVTFTNPPLADIEVNFRDGGSGETSLAQDLACDNTTGTSSTDPANGWQKTLTVTGVHAGATTVVITCTINIDP